ncbi:MAG: hypothetical protein QXL24_01660 [Candidatus Jordarchaeaceae archaeon]
MAVKRLLIALKGRMVQIGGRNGLEPKSQELCLCNLFSKKEGEWGFKEDFTLKIEKKLELVPSFCGL